MPDFQKLAGLLPQPLRPSLPRRQDLEGLTPYFEFKRFSLNIKTFGVLKTPKVNTFTKKRPRRFEKNLRGQ